jgi:hypothetical protein
MAGLELSGHKNVLVLSRSERAGESQIAQHLRVLPGLFKGPSLSLFLGRSLCVWRGVSCLRGEIPSPVASEGSRAPQDGPFFYTCAGRPC